MSNEGISMDHFETNEGGFEKKLQEFNLNEKAHVEGGIGGRLRALTAMAILGLTSGCVNGHVSITVTHEFHPPQEQLEYVGGARPRSYQVPLNGIIGKALKGVGLPKKLGIYKGDKYRRHSELETPNTPTVETAGLISEDGEEIATLEATVTMPNGEVITFSVPYSADTASGEQAVDIG
jgi:hypothetical protein